MSIAQEQRPPRSRRLERQARTVVQIARQGEGLAEGATRPATAVREGLYRRALALADAIVAALIVLGVLPLLEADARLASVLLAVPTIVLVNKLGGLYRPRRARPQQDHARRGAARCCRSAACSPAACGSSTRLLTTGPRRRRRDGPLGRRLRLLLGRARARTLGRAPRGARRALPARRRARRRSRASCTSSPAGRVNAQVAAAAAARRRRRRRRLVDLRRS